MSTPDNEPSSRHLTHLDPQGHARMVDVSDKGESDRVAIAQGRIRMSREAFDAIRDGTAPKGDVLATARIAGIMAGKRTGELIPLCHVLPATSVAVTLDLDAALPGVRAQATASVRGQTGVELEALTAVSLTLLTIYDMVKAMDRGMVIEAIELRAKAGGRSGPWERDAEYPSDP